MPEQTLTASSKQAGGDLIVGLCGFITCLATAFILRGVEQLTGLALYTWMLWFVIPLGAGVAGMIGASGYLVGAWLFGRSPSRLLLANIVLASVATFLMVHYLEYAGLVIEGKQVADYVSFPKYLDLAIQSSSLNFRLNTLSIGSTGQVGIFGYVLTVLQVAGFATGGVAIYNFLGRQPYCKQCSRYLQRKGESLRYSADAAALDRSAATVREHVRNGAFAAALAAQREFGTPDEDTGGNFRTRIHLRDCPRCGKVWAQYSVHQLSGDDWAEIPELTETGFSDQRVIL